MSIECIVNAYGMEAISQAAIHNCHGVLFRIHEENEKVKIIPIQDELETAIILAGSIPLWIDIKGPVGSNIERNVAVNYDDMMVASESKDTIRELYISYPKATYGLVEPQRGCLELDPDDYFVDFAILNFADFQRTDYLKYQFWRKKWPDVRIYAAGVYKVEHVDMCFFWKVDGIVTDRAELVQDRLKQLEENAKRGETVIPY